MLRNEQWKHHFLREQVHVEVVFLVLRVRFALPLSLALRLRLPLFVFFGFGLGLLRFLLLLEHFLEVSGGVLRPSSAASSLTCLTEHLG